MSFQKIKVPDESKDFRSRDHINLSDKRELEYWCEKYNAAPEEIQRAIDAVGTLVKDVEKRLRKKPATNIA